MNTLLERGVDVRPSLDVRDRLGDNELLRVCERSLETIINEQNPQTGLFPAATRVHHLRERHYGDSWVRDGAINILALLDPFILKLYPAGTTIGDATRAAGKLAANGMLTLFNTEPWYSGFRQGVEDAIDEYGRSYTRLVGEPPPVHMKVDGSVCAWPTQNQPDSWGEFLIAEERAIRAGALSLDETQQKTTNAIAGHIVGIDTPNHEQVSMWEWVEVHHPAPTSSIAIDAEGLQKISPFVTNLFLKEYLRRSVRRYREVANAAYPVEYTTLDHRGKTDLATYVAHSVDAFEGQSLSRYLLAAIPELGDGQYPGKRRYLGDHYDNVEGEAIWPIGTLIESKIFLERAILSLEKGAGKTAGLFAEKGLGALQRVLDMIQRVGYNVELLKWVKGELVPNGNHLLWNEALLAQAISRAVVYSRMLNATQHA